MTSTMNKEEREGAGGTKFSPILLMVVQVFLSVISRYFLHLCGCLVLNCFLEACSIYKSIIETKEVQRLTMKVGSSKVCLLSCQLYYTYETCKHYALQQRKKLCISTLISLQKLFLNIIFRMRESSEFNYGHSLQYSRERDRPKLSGCKCEWKGGQSF